MTASPVIALRPTSLNALIDQTKSTWDRADQNQADADDWYHRTGKLLIELKAKIKEEKGHGHWEATLKQMGRSLRRARELMEGKFQEQRERKRDHERKVRGEANRRHGAVFSDPDEPKEYADQPPEERWQYSLGNLCGDIIAIAPYWRKIFPGWEQFDCPPHVRKLLKEATAALASISATVTSNKR